MSKKENSYIAHSWENVQTKTISLFIIEHAFTKTKMNEIQNFGPEQYKSRG